LNLSLLGGVAYVGYGIYQERHPDPQTDPDPSKKTLVILGEFWELTVKTKKNSDRFFW
jgi:NADH:ubiquinone reductase (non-electrogenic)